MIYSLLSFAFLLFCTFKINGFTPRFSNNFVNTRVYNKLKIHAVRTHSTPTLSMVADNIDLLQSASAYIQNAQTAMVQTLLPVDQEDFFAVFIAEGISGFLGGIASKLAANFSGRRQPGSEGLLEAGTSSGAYFGIVSGARSLLLVLGASPILLNFIALGFATSTATIFKYRRQLIAPQRTRVGDGPTMYELMKFKEPSMLDMMKFADDENCQLKPRVPITGELCRVEVATDFTKWFCYYTFLTATSPTTRISDAAALGAIIGPISQFVREKDDQRMADEIAQRTAVSQESNPWKAFIDSAAGRYSCAAVEGGIQLAVYQLAKEYVISISPYFENLEQLQSLT